MRDTLTLQWSQIDKDALLKEFEVWQKLDFIKLKRKWRQDKHVTMTVDTTKAVALYTDASMYAMAGKLYGIDETHEDDRRIQPDESDLLDETFFQFSTMMSDNAPIHVKECDAVYLSRGS